MESTLKGFRIARSFKRELQVLQVSDYGEFTLPNNVRKIKFKHPESGKRTVADLTDPVVARVYAYEMEKKSMEITHFKRKLRGMREPVIEARSEDLTERILLAYFGRKQKGDL